MNLELVIKKYLCRLNEYFPGVDSSYNNVMLSETSKYICSYNLNKISFDYIYINFKNQMLCVILMHFLIWSDSTDVSDSEELIEYLETCCIVHLLDFTYVNYIYLKDNYDKPKNNHKIFILNQEPDFTITSPIAPLLRIMKENLRIPSKNI